MVEDQAECAGFAVLNEQDDGAEKIGVEEFWRGDEKLALERFHRDGSGIISWQR